MPAGGLSPDLTTEEIARRELGEEVGGTAAELRYVGQFYTSNGISNEVAYIYLAACVELGETQREPTELMERDIGQAMGQRRLRQNYRLGNCIARVQ